MTSRELLKHIVALKPAGRCGLWLGNPHPDSWPGLHRYFGTSTEEELRRKLDDDYRWKVDGPIYIPRLFDGRNKVFFMVSYEGLQERSSGGDATVVPTDAMRGGDLSALPRTIYDPTTTRTVGGAIVRDAFTGNRIPSSRISPVAQKLLGFVPKPNRPTRTHWKTTTRSCSGRRTGTTRSWPAWTGQ